MNEKKNKEQRGSRRRIVRDAEIILASPAPPLPCVVLDSSIGGFRLHVHLPAEVPDFFQLRVSDETGTYSCEVIWRRTNEIGVKTVDCRVVC